jgi:predicted amidohydrolase
MPAEITGGSFAEKQRKNRAEIRRMLVLAGRRGSDLVLFGEYANLHHRTWSKKKRECVPDPIPGEFTRAVSRIARRYHMYVAMPMLGMLNGALSSYVVLIDREGDIVGCYAKSHPTLPEQRLGMKPGNQLPVYPLDFGAVGFMTCMDIEYPEVALSLLIKGADLLLFPHVQGSWGEVDWEIRYRARAVDTGLYVVSACYGYPPGAWMPGKMIGRTSLVGRDGLILADLGRSIDLLTVDLDLDTKRISNFFFDRPHDRALAVVASRRPEIYQDLVDLQAKRNALERIRQQAASRGRTRRTRRNA